MGSGGPNRGSHIVTLADLMRDLDRKRRDAETVGATAPLANVYGAMLEQLRAVDGVPAFEPRVSTTEAAAIEGVSRATIAKWCADGRYPRAEKTSEAGEWRIPLSDLRTPAPRRQGGRGPQTPTLLEEAP